MALTLYMTTVTSSRETKSQQSDMIRILETEQCKYETVDISVDKCLLEEMRQKAGNSSALPPQLFCGDKYIGCFEDFMAAVEDGTLSTFLGVKK
ncbi:SH3 domain-binding glutamic acid-rich-like protein 3 [Mixophyes fleayi]|uniref:SH3 domain-binding glutamic acid-rich-like protein 3 n=1 Tax=Mixophyes fleayi TaxID=3061075 RepID=UPI003F4D8316